MHIKVDFVAGQQQIKILLWAAGYKTHGLRMFCIRTARQKAALWRLLHQVDAAVNSVAAAGTVRSFRPGRLIGRGERFDWLFQTTNGLRHT